MDGEPRVITNIQMILSPMGYPCTLRLGIQRLLIRVEAPFTKATAKSGHGSSEGVSRDWNPYNATGAATPGR